MSTGAAYFYYTRGQHPHVETNKAVRTDSLSEERDSAAQEGHDMKESIGRRVSRSVAALLPHLRLLRLMEFLPCSSGLRRVCMRSRGNCRVCTGLACIMPAVWWACRGTGMHQGMDTDGIFPNKKIAKAMGDVMGTSPAAKSEK